MKVKTANFVRYLRQCAQDAQADGRKGWAVRFRQAANLIEEQDAMLREHRIRQP